MKIMLVGGGSAGHITPLLAVAADIKKLRPEAQIVAVTQKGEQLAHILEQSEYIDAVTFISAGKFRRYYGEKKLAQLTDVKRLALNGRDLGRLTKGVIAGRGLLRREKPDVIFIKGGFVGVPIGLAAARQGIPYITHDSDIIPGLANRIIAGSAAVHAVGQAADLYPYPADKTVQVGVPFADTVVAVTPELQAAYRDHLGIPRDAEVVTVVGGSLGAQRMDVAVAAAAKIVLVSRPHLYILHVVGKLNEAGRASLYEDLDEASRQRVRTVTFVDDLYRYSGAADVIVTRAGANSVAEFGAQGKACIIVPNPLLTGGHQTKNAEVLQKKHAALILEESHLDDLTTDINLLLDDTSLRTTLARNLQATVITDAAGRLADVIVKLAEKK
jgi:UDP-N-acetylglucosamine--N-acetylmuramyl-(pentapeptide) pyrophosphoryl-undecaprenol N-acetylglucosamine transferase